MIRPKKHLGQHFLKNEAVAARIADSLSGEGYGQIVEIGPGMGVLTQFLDKRKEELYLVEIDPESVEYLNRARGYSMDHIIQGDFLKLPLSSVFEGPLAIIGNFPYNISSQIVFKMIEFRDMIPEMAGMFQKEVAERIVAPSGSKTYGIISVLVAAFYEREYLFTVEASEFTPPPKVRSGVIRLKRKEDYTLQCDEKMFFRVVKTAFNQRRKTLRNALKSIDLPEGLSADPLMAKRAEQIELEDFIYITNQISS